MLASPPTRGYVGARRLIHDKGQTRKAREEAKAACQLARGAYPVASELERELKR
jgi:hypothetical protein